MLGCIILGFAAPTRLFTLNRMLCCENCSPIRKYCGAAKTLTILGQPNSTLASLIRMLIFMQNTARATVAIMPMSSVDGWSLMNLVRYPASKFLLSVQFITDTTFRWMLFMRIVLYYGTFLLCYFAFFTEPKWILGERSDAHDCFFLLSLSRSGWTIAMNFTSSAIAPDSVITMLRTLHKDCRWKPSTLFKALFLYRILFLISTITFLYLPAIQMIRFRFIHLGFGRYFASQRDLCSAVKISALSQRPAVI